MAHAALKSRKREDYPFKQEYRTRWIDNDMYHHLNNSIYFHLFDSIVNAFLITRCELDPPTSSQFGLVVHNACDYFGAVAYPAVLDVGMRVRKLGKSSVTYETAIFEQGSDDVKAVGEFIHVYVEREGRRPAKDGMPAKMKEQLSQLVQTQAKL